MAETSEKCDWRSDLLALMVLDPIGAFLTVEEAMRRAGEDLATAEDTAAVMSKVLKTVSDQLAQTQRDLGYVDKAAETYERQRDDLMDLIRARADMMKPRENCHCLGCNTLREALEIVKSSEEKLKSEGDGG